jgi:hypothetical protein
MNKEKRGFAPIAAILISILIIGIIFLPNFKKTDSKSNSPTPYPTSHTNSPSFCESNNDCEIKHSNSGCGNPGCYNKNYIFPTKEGNSNGVSGICGFPSFDECRCINNSCEEFYKDSIVKQ